MPARRRTTSSWIILRDVSSNRTWPVRNGSARPRKRSPAGLQLRYGGRLSDRTGQRQAVDVADAVRFKISPHRFVRQWKLARLLPVTPNSFNEAFDHVLRRRLDREFPPFIEAPGAEIDRSDDRARLIGNDDLAMQLQVF